MVLGPYFRSHADAGVSRQRTNVFDQDDGQATVTECDAVMAMPERMDRPSQTGDFSCRNFATAETATGQMAPTKRSKEQLETIPFKFARVHATSPGARRVTTLARSSQSAVGSLASAVRPGSSQLR